MPVTVEPKPSVSKHNSSSTEVFFDGDCPLCSREIAHYQRLKGADNIVWIDVASASYDANKHGLKRNTAMARFHVRDANGKWQTGAAGFAELWSRLPAYRWLSVTVRKLRLIPLLDWFYTKFASWRLRRNCDTESCGPINK